MALDGTSALADRVGKAEGTLAVRIEGTDISSTGWLDFIRSKVRRLDCASIITPDGHGLPERARGARGSRGGVDRVGAARGCFPVVRGAPAANVLKYGGCRRGVGTHPPELECGSDGGGPRRDRRPARTT
jgi:hypothetical protein